MRVIFKWWHYNGYKDGCDVGSQNIVFYAQRVWFPPSTIQSFTSHPSGEFYIDSPHRKLLFISVNTHHIVISAFVYTDVAQSHNY